MAFMQLSRHLSIEMYPLMGGSRRAISFSAAGLRRSGKLRSENTKRIFFFLYTKRKHEH